MPIHKATPMMPDRPSDVSHSRGLASKCVATLTTYQIR
jgi:hypothetical protein